VIVFDWRQMPPPIEHDDEFRRCAWLLAAADLGSVRDSPVLPGEFLAGRMELVRNRPGPAWVPHGRGIPRAQRAFIDRLTHALPRRPLEDTMYDLLYIGLTIVAFGVLWLIVKGVEHFER
jgi:hypothetical protein